jgi:hypothetical protein
VEHVHPALFQPLELVLILPALHVLPDLSTKSLHPVRLIHACPALRVRIAFQAALLPVALDYAPLGAIQNQEEELSNCAPLVPQVRSV